mmetsp:Transcript_9613/g.29108  ORF Transcript_9613/g.29108 Transcript_9613/m.29108 type:complete len:910 (+) Transcript_9613:367-3096(+)
MKGLFNGSVSGRKVSMRGSSTKEETSEGILAKAKAARQMRLEKRRNENAFSTLASAFRSYQRLRAAKRRMKGEVEDLLQRLGSSGDVGTLAPLLQRFVFLVFNKGLSRLEAEGQTQGFVRSSLTQQDRTEVLHVAQAVLSAELRDALKTPSDLRSCLKRAAPALLLSLFVIGPEFADDCSPDALEACSRELSAATDLCSLDLWGSGKDAADVVLSASQMGLYGCLGRYIATFTQLKQPLQSLYTSKAVELSLLPFVHTSDRNKWDPRARNALAEWVEDILTIEDVVNCCSEEARQQLELHLGHGELFAKAQVVHFLDRSSRAAKNERGPLGISGKHETLAFLSNVFQVSKAVFETLDILSNDIQTGLVLVLSEFLHRFSDLLEDDEGSDDDEEVDVVVAKKSQEARAVFNMITPVITNSTVLASLMSGENISRVCLLLVRLTEGSAQLENSVLSALAFRTGDVLSRKEGIIRKLWRACSVDPNKFPECDGDVLVRKDSVNYLEDRAAVLVLFCKVYAHFLRVQDAAEFYRYRSPFSKDELRQVAATVRDVFLWSIWPTPSNTSPFDVFGDLKSGHSSTARLLYTLYLRDSANERQRFADDAFWTSDKIKHHFNDNLIDELSAMQVNGAHSMNAAATTKILSLCPIMVPFEFREELFQLHTNEQKSMHPEKRATIRRQYIVEDGYVVINPLRTDLRGHMRISFMDSNGLFEAGIDGGGLFKVRCGAQIKRTALNVACLTCDVLCLRLQEFMHELIARVFSPEMGLMIQTWDGKLYPNPASELVVGPNHLEQFQFLGRVVGKSLQEFLLVNLPFADFFLAKFLQRNSSLDDLESFDPQLYRNLMSMKKMSAAEIEALGLTFTVVRDEYGGTEVPLIPNGRGRKTSVNSRPVGAASSDETVTTQSTYVPFVS